MPLEKFINTHSCFLILTSTEFWDLTLLTDDFLDDLSQWYMILQTLLLKMQLISNY